MRFIAQKQGISSGAIYRTKIDVGRRFSRRNQIYATNPERVCIDKWSPYIADGISSGAIYRTKMRSGRRKYIKAKKVI